MIKNLLFDLGGVIMDIEKQQCINAFRRLGLRDAESYFGDFVQKGPFAALESGEITPAQFRDTLRPAIADGNVSDNDIDDAFMHFLIGIPLHRLEGLRELGKKYHVYMLSNTNPIMWNAFIAESFRQEGLEREDYFEGIVTSFEAKCMKPGKDIFDYTRHKLGIDPEETLFLDDSEANCEAARRLGWNAEVVPPGTEFIKVLENLGL